MAREIFQRRAPQWQSVFPASDPVDALDCNCGVGHVHTRRDFGGSWEAIIFQGKKRGKVVKTSAPGFTEEKWLAIGASARYGTDFRNARPEQKKGASSKRLGRFMNDVMVAEGLHPCV